MAQQQGLNHTEKNASLTPAQTQIGEAVRDGVSMKNQNKIIHGAPKIYMEKPVKKNKKDLRTLISDPHVTSAYLFYVIALYFFFCFRVALVSKRKYPKSFKAPREGFTPHDKITKFLKLRELAHVFFKAFSTIFEVIHVLILSLVNVGRKILRKPSIRSPEKPETLCIEVETYFISRDLTFKDGSYLVYNWLWSLILPLVFVLIGFAIDLSLSNIQFHDIININSFNLLIVSYIIMPSIILSSFQIFYYIHVNTYLEKKYNIPYLSWIYFKWFLFLLFVYAAPFTLINYYYYSGVAIGEWVYIVATIIAIISGILQIFSIVKGK